MKLERKTRPCILLHIHDIRAISLLVFIVMVYKYLRYTLLASTFPYGVQRHTLIAVHYTVMLESK